MPIKYALFENNITSDPDDYAAMVQISGSKMNCRSEKPVLGRLDSTLTVLPM